MKILLFVFMSEIKIDLSVRSIFISPNNTKSSIFKSGGATSENTTFGVHE